VPLDCSARVAFKARSVDEEAAESLTRSASGSGSRGGGGASSDSTLAAASAAAASAVTATDDPWLCSLSFDCSFLVSLRQRFEISLGGDEVGRIGDKVASRLSFIPISSRRSNVCYIISFVVVIYNILLLFRYVSFRFAFRSLAVMTS